MTRRRTILLLPALLLTRCGPPPPPPPPALKLSILCGADQNPDASGRPSPAAIRLYFLNASAKFERADVFALTERERATLGEDDAGSEEFVLRAGETRMIDRVPKSGVQFLGVTVLFRDIDHATWRAVAPIAASGPTNLELTTAGIVATLQPVKAKK
ncbi:type VI secretion system lipoprotein TssJ [Acidisphaera sp. L21]|uniref:type VI secretion system lipoprotein TssJ n=1 Tax=Acidisphaera sp. L21 TaxID=1641851 RepID=UPI00131C3BEF|nr:type VI secretion system lipoprotein TssJ [Acidisphaera sp. L21]